MRKHLCRLLLIFMVLLIDLTNEAIAQQTIISVPSSEVLPTGDIILKESNRFRPFEDGQFIQLTPTFTFGTGFDTETSIGAATNLKPDKDASVKLEIATKKVFFLGSRTRLTVGGRVSPYLNTGQMPDSMVFAHGTYRIPKTRTSLTSGVYVQGKNSAPNKAGVILGIDQVIIPNKLRIAADYMSRDESWGALNVGFKYRPIPDLSITTAVTIPNGPNNNLGFIVSFSKYVGNIKEVYGMIKPSEPSESPKEEIKEENKESL